MTLTLDIPDDLVSALGTTPGEQGQLVREAIAVHLYREGRISMRAMGRMAGVGEDYWSADEFRERHHLPVDVADPDKDRKALDFIRRQG